jgi:hypothetical protein
MFGTRRSLRPLTDAIRSEICSHTFSFLHFRSVLFYFMVFYHNIYDINRIGRGLPLLWRNSPISDLGLPYSSPSIRGLIPGFETLFFFAVRGRQPLAQPPIWRTRVSLLVWIIPFDLSGMGGSTSSYATAGTALRVICPHKPYHYGKVATPSGG